MIAAPYDARAIGPLLARLRRTLRETSFLGMPIMAGADLGAFLSMTRSFKSLLHVGKRFVRHLRDLALHGRAMHLVNGVALVARLAMHSLMGSMSYGDTGQCLDWLTAKTVALA